ncbi:MAG: ABC transporter permease [Acidobacteriota bacterium]
MPDWKQEIRRRLAGLKLEATREAEIVEELSQHLDDGYAELRASGKSEEEATRTVLAELSNSEVLARELRCVEGRLMHEPSVLGARRKNMAGDLLTDLRYGFRMLVKNPGFTFIAVMSLALGIGANTAIFSLVNATLLRQLPVASPERLLYVYDGNPGAVFSYPAYSELRDQNQAFDGLIAWGGISASLNSDEQSEGADLVTGAIVTGNFFETLGVRAALGRVITPDDDQTPGAHPVTVISHGLWQSRLGGKADIIGRELVLNGQRFTVIGVVPPEFQGAQMGVNRDIYVPMMMQAVMRPPRSGYSGEMNPDLLKVRTNRWLYSIGRLKPGLTSEQAQAELTVFARQQEQANPERDRDKKFTTSPVSLGDPGERVQMIPVARLLLSIVGAVLLIACANVANLLLARASARRKEIAVRLAIGASRGRLIRQLLTESLLLAFVGGVAGLLLAWLTVDLLKASPPPPGALPVTPDFAIDLRVLLFTLGLSLLTGIIFGLAPAVRAARPDLVPALKDQFSPDQHVRRFSARNLLVVGQVALSLVLLIAAGLFLRSLKQAQTIDPGFDAQKLLTAPLNINLLRYTKPQGRDFYQRVVESVGAVSSVESASVARNLPLSGRTSVSSLLIEGRSGPDNQFRSEGGGFTTDDNSISTNTVSLDYFETMGIRLLRGRLFESQDTEDKPRVVIVNEAFERRHLGGQDAMGKRLTLGGPKGPWHEVTGVVRDSKYVTLGETPTPMAYLPLQQNHETGVTLLVRTAGDPPSVAAAVRQEVQSLEKNLPITAIRPMNELVGASLYAARMGAIVVGVFGALALLLAAVGLYGVMSFSVSRRTREFGIRVALGAQSSDVFRLVIRDGVVLVAAGIALGLSAAAMLTRFLTSFLYGIGAIDTLTFTSIPVVLIFVALAACYVPARRAMRTDPMLALRNE